MTAPTGPLEVAVAAPHRDAVAAAGLAVSEGGNAVDAALAAAVTLTVVYPHQCSIGGDLIAVIRRGSDDRSATAVVSVGAAPADTDTEALAAEGSMPRQGPHTVTVPGVVAGWNAISDLGARLPIRRSFRSAQELAAEGVEVSAGLARGLQERRSQVLADPGLRSVFAPDGRLLEPGDSFRQSALAETFESLFHDLSAFYSGSVAERLTRTLRELGGRHSVPDFAHHEAEVGPALAMDVGATRWYGAPPPAPGAVLLGLLPVALRSDVGASDLLATFLAALATRDRLLGDPRGGPVDVDRMLRPTAELGSGRDGGGNPKSGDTVVVASADSSGTTVSLVQSVYQLFGAGILDPRTGIVLHNRGSAFSTDSSSPARVGPGLRPPHTLCPVIGESADAVVAAGCQGGRAQPWILAQVARDLLDPDVDPGVVVARPRWVLGGRDMGHEMTTLVAEPGVVEAVRAAEEAGLPTERRSEKFDAAGHLQVARITRSSRGAPVLDAASDPRADGAASTFTAGEPA